MLSLITVALFTLAVSAAPPAVQTPVAVPLEQYRAAHYPLAVPASRATYNYIPQQYQVQSFQPAHLSAYHYQAQPQVVKFAAPAAPAAPVVHAAPKPLLKEYPLHEGHHAPQPQWAIVRSNLDNNFDGHFQYDYETENGISMASSGALRQLGPEAVGQVMQGQYSYTAPDGQVITTTYTADENGFVASGVHLPQAPVEPELPPLIAKSLAYIRSIPPKPENQQ